jgi:steroid delta-isomerase-like uncharacterized protein
MSTKENKAIIRRNYEEAFNDGNLSVLDEIVAPEFILHGAPPGSTGPEVLRQAMRSLRTAFPDGHMTVEDLIAEGDKVVARLTLRGTHSGDFQGIPPTGKQVTMTGISISRITDNKIQEYWSNRDDLEVMRQLGALPHPALRPV